MCKGKNIHLFPVYLENREINISVREPFSVCVCKSRWILSVSHANVETRSAIAFVMEDDRLFVLVYQPLIITFLCGKREPLNHHHVCAHMALSSMLIYLLSLTYLANMDEYAQNINYKQINIFEMRDNRFASAGPSFIVLVLLCQAAKIGFHT